MKQLLIRADDVGYSYAVNLGIARTVREGLVRSLGVMPNMPETARGVAWVKQAAADAGVTTAIGQHTNLCLGTPCADPALIPSITDENGQLKSSKTYRAAYAKGEDFVNYDEVKIEIEAQYELFKEVVGAEPDYFEAHAVMSKSLNRAIHDVAVEHGLCEQPASFDPTATVTCDHTPVRMVLRSMGPDADFYDPAAAIREAVEQMADGETIVFVCHPGYLDNYILTHSSLTTNRTREVDGLIDPDLRAWLEAQPDLRLVDYRDL